MNAQHDPKDNRSRTLLQRMTLRVGPGGDIEGLSDKTLQAGVDYLHRLGGGTLRIQPGQYRMQNTLHLRPGVHIQGSGPDCVLFKEPSACSELICDSDWYESQVRVADPTGFSAGCGIALRSQHAGALQVIKDTVTAVEGDILHLSKCLEKNAWLSEGATAATLFPLLTAEWVDDITVEDLVIDGNRKANEELNGNYVGGVFLQHCDRYRFRHVVSRNFNGDGFSFQVCDDIHFENCRAENNANLGFHPGSGSQRPRFNDCQALHNSQGIFFCWGVTDGLAQRCILNNNSAYGCSIGHRDTDNQLLDCTLEENGLHGLLFRQPQSPFRGAHRNKVERCLFRNNGALGEGIAIEFQGTAHGVTIRNNRFENTGLGSQKTAIRLSAESTGTRIEKNTYHSIAHELLHKQTNDTP